MQNKNTQTEEKNKQFAAGGMKKDEASSSKEFQKPAQRSDDSFDEEEDGVERAPAREEKDGTVKRTTEQKDKGSRV